MNIPAPPWLFPVEDHTLIVRPGAERLFLLNSTARFIWDTYAESGDEAACVAALAGAFGLSPAHVAQDVAATLATWDAGGLLTQPTAHTPAPFPPPPATAPQQWRHYQLGAFAFSVGLEEGTLAEDLPLRIAHYEIPAPPPGAPQYTVRQQDKQWIVLRDGAHVDTGESPFAARVVLLYDALRAAYGAEPWCASLHAGAIGLGDRCVVVAGASGAGKSTLAIAAQLAGLDCLGDDAAPVLEHSGHIAAVPLAAMLREGSWGLFTGLEHRFHLSGIHVRETGRVRFLAPRAPQPLHTRKPCALLFVRRAPGAAPALRPMGLVETLTQLGETGFWVRPDHVAVTRWLAWLATLPRYALHYDTPGEGVALLRSLLAP
jgi:hypothetical protein